MARIRTIKPETPRDAKLARLPREARYTFWMLITQADDEGFFPANPRTLLGLIYPHDTDISERMLSSELDALRGVGRLESFDTEDGPIGRIVNFKKHQKIDHPSKSYLASLSRTPRETFAPVVLSLDLVPVPVVLSPREDAPARSPDGALDTALADIHRIREESRFAAEPRKVKRVRPEEASP